jgi:hypothetical protein
MTASDASVAAEVAVVVETDVPCPCGYNLRGLPRDGRCPECGLTVEEGLRRFEQPMDPEQFRRVVSGISFMLIAHAGWLVTGLALAPQRNSFWAYALLGFAGPTTFLTMMQVRDPTNLAIPVALFLTSLLWFAGVWKVTTPSRRGWPGPNRLARLTRYAMIPTCAAAGAAYLFWDDAMMAGSVVYDAVAAALLWWYLIRLTKHVRLEGVSYAARWVLGLLFVAKVTFASNLGLAFSEPMFWVVLGAFAATGLGASLYLLLIRHATRRLLESRPPTAADGTACGSP